MSNHTVLRLEYDIPAASSLPGSTTYISLFDGLSALNHRLYRQFNVLHANIKIEPDIAAGIGADVAFNIQCLPTSWPVMNSLRMAKKTYDKVMDQASETEGTSIGRWHDFRMYYDVTDATAKNLLSRVSPTNYTLYPAGGNSLNGAEAAASLLHAVTNTNIYTFHAIGATNVVASPAFSSFGAIYEYDRSKNTTIDDPNDAPGSAYNEFDITVDESNAHNLEADGSAPPYDPVDLSIARQAYSLAAHGSTNQIGYSKTATGNIKIPLGLIRVTTAVEGVRKLIVEVRPGNYKGVMVEAI